MTVPSLWISAWTPAFVNHLWHSTAVFLIAFVLTEALRRNQARTRYWIWFIASIKFLFPFSLIIAVGEWCRSLFAAPIQHPTLAMVVEQITEPYHAPNAIAAIPLAQSYVEQATTPNQGNVLPLILVAVWLCGFVAVSVSWLRGWWRAYTAVRAASDMGLLSEVPVLSSSDVPEPCVFGIFRPVLLLPSGITERLTPAQLGTIIAHEMCHLHRRDNLTAAIHMFAEAIFWFHPAVWWIKARLLEERERACDEAVVHSGSNATLYAETILNVCKFCVESPLACAAGVTGSDLKRRIGRIMSEQMSCKLDLTRKLLLCTAGIVALAIPLIFGLVHVDRAHAQNIAEGQDIVGTWQGVLNAGKQLRVVIKISINDKGSYKSVLYSIDEGTEQRVADSTTLQGATFRMSIKMIGGTYEGKVSPDGKSISGVWNQGSSVTFNLVRATPSTEWPIPTAPVVAPMDPNASPSFESATITPSNPGEKRMGVIVGPEGLLTAYNQTLPELISFAYGVHQKQIVGLEPWMSQKYDIVGKPVGQGAPSETQWKEMLQKMLADRFQLKFHHANKELPVYVLSIGQPGPKLTKTGADPTSLPAFFFRGYGQLVVRNGTVGDFADHVLQGQVLDRPVVDRTSISGKYDFTLDWTPDDSQFPMFHGKLPPAPQGYSAPSLHAALQDQLGLKLEAAQAPVDVLILDRAVRP